MGSINGQDIWLITDTELIPYKRTTLHLNERQVPNSAAALKFNFFWKTLAALETVY